MINLSGGQRQLVALVRGLPFYCEFFYQTDGRDYNFDPEFRR